MSDYYIRLRNTLLAGHPKTGAYSADDAIAESQINAINLHAATPVSEPEKAIRKAGKWVSYIERSEAKNPDGTFVNPNMFEFMSPYQSRTSEIDFMEDYWSALIDACVTEGSIGAGAGQAFKDWSDNRQSHAQREDLGTPTVGDIAYARTL